MEKIVRVATVFLIGFSLLTFSFLLAEETEVLKINDEEVFQWVANRMEIQFNPEIPLPEIKKVSPEELMDIAVSIIVRDFKDTPFGEVLQGKSQKELTKELKNMLAQLRKEKKHELVNNQGCYDPYRNIIYLAEGSSQWMLAHEATHYFQVKYQKRYPETNEGFKNLSEEEARKIEKLHEKLEEEAERIEEEFRQEFFPTKIEALSPIKAPTK